MALRMEYIFCILPMVNFVVLAKFILSFVKFIKGLLDVSHYFKYSIYNDVGD